MKIAKKQLEDYLEALEDVMAVYCDGMSDYDALKQKNDELGERIDELEGENVRLKCDIGVLKKKCHKLEEATEWHKFDKGNSSTFPPEYTKVLFVNDNDMLVGFWGNRWFTVPLGKTEASVYLTSVVAWRELPEVPKFFEK